MQDPSSVAAVAACLVTAAVAGGVGAAVWARSTATWGLAALGYRARRDGTYTRVAGPVAVTFRPPGRWTARIGVVPGVAFTLVPRRSPAPADGFEVGHPDVDRWFHAGSSRGAHARLALTSPAVVDALRPLAHATITFVGDELDLVSPRPGAATHRQVLALAAALAGCADAVRPL